MASQPFYFVSHFPDDEFTIKEKELEDASRRSHAAKIAHQRRKKSKVKTETKAVGPTQWRFLGREEGGDVSLVHPKVGTKRFENKAHGRYTLKDSHARKIALSTETTAVPLANNPLSHGNSDPFSTSVSPLTARHFNRLRAFEDLVFHVAWPDHSGIDLDPMVKDWSKFLSTTFSSRSSLEALLATCSIWIKPRFRDPIEQASCTADFLKHRGESLVALRTELNHAFTESRPPLPTIMAVVFLTVALAISGEPAEAGIHFKGLRILVEAYGGFLALPYPARTMLMGCDHAVAVANMQLFTWSSKLYDPGPLEISPVEEHKVDVLMRSWPRLHKQIPEALRGFFGLHREVYAVHQVALKLNDRHKRTKLLRWVLLRKRVVYSTTQAKRCFLAASADHTDLSEVEIDLAIEVSVRIAVQYMFRVIYWPKPGHASIFLDLNDIQMWLGYPRIRSRMSTTFLLWLLAVCTSLEQALQLARPRPWWHASRFLLLAEAMHLDSIARLAPVMNQFLWADEPIGRHIQRVFEERDSIYAETNCERKIGLSPPEIKEDKAFIWDGPPLNAPEDRRVVVQWSSPKAILK